MMSIIVGLMNQYHNDGHKIGLKNMNGIRVARKYIERCSDEDLQALLELSQDDTDPEALVIIYLIKCEIEKRK